jgi:hypothetical protein
MRAMGLDHGRFSTRRSGSAENIFTRVEMSGLGLRQVRSRHAVCVTSIAIEDLLSVETRTLEPARPNP